MRPPTPFPYAASLDALELGVVVAPSGVPNVSLIRLLKAYKATLQAAHDTTLAADELRKFQKYAKPGQPSMHIVQLRQKQAAARQATNTAQQALIKAAAALVREANIDVPERVPLDEFIVAWIDDHVPKDSDV